MKTVVKSVGRSDNQSIAINLIDQSISQINRYLINQSINRGGWVQTFCNNFMQIFQQLHKEASFSDFAQYTIYTYSEVGHFSIL